VKAAAVTILVMLALLPGSCLAAQDVPSPAFAQQLTRVMDRAEEDPEWALERLAEMVRANRNRPTELRYAVRQRAAMLMQMERLDLAAEEMLAAVTGKDPGYAPELRFLLGQVWLLKDDARTALGHLQLWARHADPLDPAGLFLVGYAHLQLDEFEPAAKALETAIATSIKPRPQWFEILAYTYTRLDRPADAIGLLETLIASQPQQSRWWRQLGSIYLLIDDVPRGTAGLTVLAELEPLGLSDSRSLARLFASLDMPADAAYVLDAAITRARTAADLARAPSEPAGSEKPEVPQELPGYEDVMLLAELWIMAREFDAAVGTLKSASAMQDDGEAQTLLGQLYLQREDYPQADRHLDAALAAYGEEPPPRLIYLKAVVALNRGDDEAASRALKRISDDQAFAQRAARLQRYIDSRRQRGA
jgi:tetratricopeptide (TPR) repeat protein